MFFQACRSLATSSSSTTCAATTLTSIQNSRLPVESLSRIRAKNAINLLALTNPGHGQTPTKFQHGSYPAWAQPGITVLPEGVNLDVCRPDPAMCAAPFALPGFEVLPGEKLVTYVARDLEPYRGFHVMMRASAGAAAGACRTPRWCWSAQTASATARGW